VPAGKTLRQVWAAQYLEGNGQFGWREVKAMPSPATRLPSPYATEARYSTKREVEWGGYTVPGTATCEAETPHWIVNGETTPATTPDDHMLTRVHTSLERRGLLPAEPLGDKGYTDSPLLVESQQTYGGTLLGPVADDARWQARAGTGLDQSQVLVDWERKVVPCPLGKQRLSWLPNTYKHGMTWEGRFARTDCPPCLHRAQGTRAKQEPRLVGLQERAQYEARHAARQRQPTAACQRQYAPRAGIEHTHAQGRRRCGLRQARYSGLAKTH
jgi:transposase